MGGAPITITLFKNGIHIPYADPELVTSKALEEEMLRSFNAGEDDRDLATRLLHDRGLLKRVKVAVDSYAALDRREEVCPGEAVPI
jgi:hypothetical protein